MKKALLTLLCFLIGFSLIACGQNVVTSSSGNQVGIKDEDPSEEEVISTSILSISLDPQKIAAYPLNADDSALSLPGYIGYIEMGMYPQTIAHHRAVAEMSATTDSTGYYISAWDNEHYAKINKPKVAGERFKFSEDTLIDESNVYYFKVEPVRWWVFLNAESFGGEDRVTLISDLILDSLNFCDEYSKNIITLDYERKDTDILANNWGYSELRTWLNGDFLTKVFTPAEAQKLIARDTSSVSPTYNQDSPTEKIWVPSATEMQVYQRLFSALSLNMKNHYVQPAAVVSDYARCRNTFMSIYPEFYGCGRYWTSTAGKETYQIAYVPCDYHDDGGYGESVGASFMGVRPVICMNVNDIRSILKDIEEE